MSDADISRRDLLRGAAVIGAGTLLPRSRADAEAPLAGQVPRRPMGRTGLQVSSLGLGGYHLGSARDEKTAIEIVARAFDAGVNFFDNCWEYHGGQSERWLGAALKGRRDRSIVMTKVCTHGRSGDLAMRQLEDSLRRLQTDHLDVWQVHEVIYDDDPEEIFASDGVASALVRAKQQGKARFIGFTGHKDPALHLKMLSYDFPFDTIQMPLNCFDASFRSFEAKVLPVAMERGLAIFGMKSLGGGEMVAHGAITPAEGLRYAMSLPVSTTISGMDSLLVLEQNLAIAQQFQPFGPDEMQALRERCRSDAGDGRYELFKTTKKYDGAVGREQHHFPPSKDLPL
jgi:aryl-alcohol dehydrogenase-like predicted oxidoreductase